MCEWKKKGFVDDVEVRSLSQPRMESVTSYGLMVYEDQDRLMVQLHQVILLLHGTNRRIAGDVCLYWHKSEMEI